MNSKQTWQCANYPKKLNAIFKHLITNRIKFGSTCKVKAPKNAPLHLILVTNTDDASFNELVKITFLLALYNQYCQNTLTSKAITILCLLCSWDPQIRTNCSLERSATKIIMEVKNKKVERSRKQPRTLIAELESEGGCLDLLISKKQIRGQNSIQDEQLDSKTMHIKANRMRLPCIQ